MKKLKDGAWQEAMSTLEMSGEKADRQVTRQPLATAQRLLPSMQTSSTFEVMTQQGTQSLSVISQEKNKSEKAGEAVSYPGGREQIYNTNIC